MKEKQTALGRMRSQHVKRRCHEQRRGFPPAERSVNLLWHVRTGDICLHCEPEALNSYYLPLWQRLRSALGGRPFTLRFETQRLENVSFLRPAFAEAQFTTSPLLDCICLFLTADVLITSGSGLPVAVSAFAPPFTPVVFEEVRKEARMESHTHFKNGSARGAIRSHFYDEGEAVLVTDGVVELGDEALLGMMVFPRLLELEMRQRGAEAKGRRRMLLAGRGARLGEWG